MTGRALGNVLAAATAVITGIGAAQAPSPPPAASRAPLIVAADKYDRSPALRDIPAAPQALSHMPDEREPAPRHRGRRGGSATLDPVAQDYPSASIIPAPLQSVEGIGNLNGVLPPDTNGDVGPNHYVQWVNLSFAIYSKGSPTTPPSLVYGPVPGNTLWAGFGGPCETSNDGDPVVRYDHLADRWVMSQLALPNSFFGLLFAPFYQCIAVSATPDPAGAYYRYQFSFNKLNDYPKLGVWPDAYYMTINEYQPISLQFAGQGVLAFDRSAMLSGLPARVVYFDLGSVDINLGGMLPSDLDGPPPLNGSPNYFVQVDDDAWGYSPDQLQIWQLHVDWTNPSASSFTGPTVLPTAPFDSDLCGYARNCVPQPGTTVKVDALSDRLMYRLQYRNLGSHESLVVNHTVDVDGNDHAAIRWYEIRNPGTTPQIFQQGTYAPDADHRWMGSTAMDALGNIALGFSVSGSTTSPSIRYTGRLAGDPPGVMTQGETDLAVGSGSQTHASGRWGDYSLMAVDPVDDCTFWYTQEYYAVTSSAGWQTRIGSFAFPSCGPVASDLPFVSVTATTASANEAGPTSGAFTVARTGDTAAPLTVAYTVGGTATRGVDYIALSGTVTIPAGASTAPIVVTPIDDPLVEPNETVIVSLGMDTAYRLGTPATGNVTIVSDDVPPDLVVSTVTAPATTGAGATISVTDTTANQGGGPADASATGFYLSANTLLEATDVFLGSRPVPALAAGTSSSASTGLTIPQGTATGTYFVFAKADVNNALAEAQETNNAKISAAVRIGPDLVVSTLTAPATAAAGGSIVVSDTTANQGGGGADASTTRFYLSTNVTLDTADVLLGSRTVPALDAGQSSAASTLLTIPAGTTAGLYTVLAKADAAAVIAETTETNNTKFTAAIQIGPDLVVSTLAAPAMAAAGGSIPVIDTTTNRGAGGATASVTSFYLSTNISLDAADVYLNSRPVPDLAPGAADTASTSLTIPAGTPAGLYYVFAKADGNNAVGETQEGNNVKLSPAIRIGPDLIVSSVTAPSTAGAGGAIVVNDTTKNQGAADAAASATGFYISTNTILDAADVFLGSRPVPALAAGATSSSSTSLQIPAATATGSYFVLAVAETNHEVAESVETNNTLFSAGMRIGPDLIISAFAAPSTAVVGGTMTVTDTTQNAGGGAAPASTTEFYLSTNLTRDPSDVLIGSRAVRSLAAGAINSGSSVLTIPAATAPGTYFIIAAADGPNAIVESSETNNTRALGIRVVAP